MLGQTLHETGGILGAQVNDKCRSLVFFSYFLHWFYDVDPEWTEEHLLALLAGGTRDQKDAFWSGYLWGMRSIPSFELSLKLKPYLVEKVVERGHEDRNKRDGLVSLVLASWVYSDEGSEVRYDDSELRDLLLQGGDEFRAQALSQMERRGKAEGQDGQTWREKQESFLRDVWPVQLAARTTQSPARLVELAFSNEDQFIKISELILPLIGPIERDHIMLPSLRREEKNIINAHPKRVLDILCIALPDDANKWPYEIDATIKRIAEVEPELRTNPKWVELMRRWNSR